MSKSKGLLHLGGLHKKRTIRNYFKLNVMKKVFLVCDEIKIIRSFPENQFYINRFIFHK